MATIQCLNSKLLEQQGFLKNKDPFKREYININISIPTKFECQSHLLRQRLELERDERELKREMLALEREKEAFSNDNLQLIKHGVSLKQIEIGKEKLENNLEEIEILLNPYFQEVNYDIDQDRNDIDQDRNDIDQDGNDIDQDGNDIDQDGNDIDRDHILELMKLKSPFRCLIPIGLLPKYGLSDEEKKKKKLYLEYHNLLKKFFAIYNKEFAFETYSKKYNFKSRQAALERKIFKLKKNAKKCNEEKNICNPVRYFEIEKPFDDICLLSSKIKIYKGESEDDIEITKYLFERFKIMLEKKKVFLERWKLSLERSKIELIVMKYVKRGLLFKQIALERELAVLNLQKTNNIQNNLKIEKEHNPSNINIFSKIKGIY
jgi:hypothetical protein